MIHRFRVSTTQTGRRRDVSFVIYDDVAELRRAAARFRHFNEGSFENALGVSQPRWTVRVADDGSEETVRGSGIIRLWKEQMGAAVLAHECAHMALAIYREDFGKASLRNMKNEEVLCHIVSDLVRGANRKLWKLGVYS